MVKLRNGLCGINIYEDFSDISGVSFQNIKVDLYRDNRKNMEFYATRKVMDIYYSYLPNRLATVRVSSMK